MHGGGAERAVDGSRNPRFAGGSCTHTRTEDYPTWVVDLGSLSEIYMVNVTNRDGGFVNSLRNKKNYCFLWTLLTLSDVVVILGD